MIQYRDFIYYEGTNNPVVNAEVSVYIANTTTLATLYTDGTGATQKSNPVTSDQTGMFEFYAAGGVYDIYFLGVKQYQISINEAIGLPDPINVQTINCTYLNVSQSLSFTGLANRLIGNFSANPISDRLLFQTSVVDGGTYVGAIPNGISTGCSLGVFNSSDPNNAAKFLFEISNTAAYIRSDINGTGTQLPLVFRYSTTEKMRMTATAVLMGTPFDEPNAIPHTLQVKGGISVYNGTITSPTSPTTSAFPIHNLGDTTSTTTIANECQSDNTSQQARLSFLRATLSGNPPIAGTNLGVINWGHFNSSGLHNGATISGYAMTDWVTGVQSATQLIFSVADSVTLGAQARMVLRPNGTLAIGNVNNDVLNTVGNFMVQVQSGTETRGGLYINSAPNFTYPLVVPLSVTNSPIRIIGNSVNTATVRASMFNDVNTTAHGFTSTKNALDGSMAPINWSLGAIRFGSINPTTGADKTVSYMEGYTEENLTDTNCGGGIRFQTTPVGTATASEKMRITGSGNVLIGSTTDTGQKLQITGATINNGPLTVSGGALDVNTALSPITVPPGAIRLVSGGANIVNSAFTDTATGTGHRFCLYRNQANGALPVNGNSLGAIAWGTNNNGSMINAALITAYADENFIAGTAQGTHLNFNVTAVGTTSAAITMIIKGNGSISMPRLSIYADNAAALAGGLVAGDIYRTATGQLMIVY